MLKLPTFLSATLLAVLLSTDVSFALNSNAPGIDIPGRRHIEMVEPIGHQSIDMLPASDVPDTLPPYVRDAITGAVLGSITDGDAANQMSPDSAVAAVLVCIVEDSDLILINKGDAIGPGVRVQWATRGDHGTIKLLNGLAAGHRARIDDVADGDAGGCTAEILR